MASGPLGSGTEERGRSSFPKAVRQTSRRFVKRQRCTSTQCAVSIGIDLGTSTSAVAALTGGSPQVLPWPDGKKTIPSVVAYAEVGQGLLITPACLRMTLLTCPPLSRQGRLLVGHAAAQQAAQNPSNTFSSVKRIIGRSRTELLQAGHLSANVVEGPAGAAVLSSPTQGHLLPEQLSSELLRHLLQHAQLQLDDEVAHVVSPGARLDVVMCNSAYTWFRAAVVLPGCCCGDLRRLAFLVLCSLHLPACCRACFWLDRLEADLPCSQRTLAGGLLILPGCTG